MNGVGQNHVRSSQLKLIYFEERGKIDLIKLLLACIEQPYEDIRVNQAELSTYQPLAPFNQLPLLIINDQHRISQEISICRYLAQVGGLTGANLIQSTTCDMIVEQLRECTEKKQNHFALDKTLEGLEKLTSLNGENKFIVGSSLTWADLALVNAWEWLFSDYESMRTIGAKYPLIKSHSK